MNALFPFLGAILQSASYTLDKAVLSLKNVSYKTYVGVSFPLLVFFDYIIFLAFRPEFSFGVFTASITLILLASALLNIGTNVLYYRALADEALGEMQTLGLLGRIPAIIFALIAFSDERDWPIVGLAILSALFVIWSHWENHHFVIKKNTLMFMVWFLFIVPFGALFSKILLGAMSPIVMALFQDGIIAIALGWFYFKESLKLSRAGMPFIILTNICSSAGWILYFFSVQKTGIVYTALLFSLQPLLTYLASVLFLKERIEKKKMIAFAAVLICAGIAQVASPLRY